MSALQIGRMLGVSYKTAWFMCHRIRESLREHEPDDAARRQEQGRRGRRNLRRRQGDQQAQVQAPARSAGRHRQGTGLLAGRARRDASARSTCPDVTAKNLRPILVTQDRTATSYLMTDDSAVYRHDRRASSPATARSTTASRNTCAAAFCHTNTVEGYFSILKRGIVGTYHHVIAAAPEALPRRVRLPLQRARRRSASTTRERTAKSIPGIVGKRLTYRRTGRTEEGRGRHPVLTRGLVIAV